MSSIDLAVLNKQMYPISQILHSNYIYIDDLSLSTALFKTTFFNGNIFTVNKPVQTASLPFTLIDKALVGGIPIDLYSEVLSFAAADLGVNESEITNVSKIEIRKECNNLNMSSLNVTTSLKWSDISSIITPYTPIVITVVLTNCNPSIKNICIVFRYFLIS
jgi:hypothetical protein